MKRTGFARPQFAPPAPSPGRIVRAFSYGTQAYSGGGKPKEPRLEYPHLLLMQRRPHQRCLMDVPGVCGLGWRDDCCACHGNGYVYNKGMGMKAHDFFIVRGCARCHTWLDSSYSASNEDRQVAFQVGLQRQIAEWQEMVLAKSTSLRDHHAAQWALNNLRERGHF